jgi:hypothetical protein
MTFLTTRFRLARTLTAKELERLSHLSTQYGIRGVSIENDELLVEYDASRLHEAEVLAAVRRLGINVEPGQEIPAGAVNHTGEFRDFAWPVTGISPANQSQK